MTQLICNRYTAKGSDEIVIFQCVLQIDREREGNTNGYSRTAASLLLDFCLYITKSRPKLDDFLVKMAGAQGLEP